MHIVLSISLYKVGEHIHATGEYPYLGILIQNPVNTFLHRLELRDDQHSKRVFHQHEMLVGADTSVRK